MLETFHSDSRLGQVPAPGERSMISKQNGDMSPEKGLGRIAQRQGPGGSVGDAGHLAHQQRDFGKHVTGEPLPYHREGRGCGRMGVYDGATFTSLSIGPEV
jgi:hypothetical protein